MGLCWVRRILPNLLTLLRLSIGIVLFFNWPHFIKEILFLTGLLSDCLDGFFARRWKVCSSLGAFLDPVADRFLVYALAWSCISSCPHAHHHLFLIPLRDIALLLYWLYWAFLPSSVMNRDCTLKKSMLSGKVLTIFQAFLIVALFKGWTLGWGWFFFHLLLIGTTAYELSLFFD